MNTIAIDQRPVETYELRRDDETALKARLSQIVTANRSDYRPAILCVAVDGLDPLANLGRAIEQHVFNSEAGDHSPEVMDREYGPYEDRSIFFLAWDTELESVVGVLRCITGSAAVGQPVKSIRDSMSIPGYEGEFIDLRENSSIAQRGLIGQSEYERDDMLSRGFLERFHGMEPGEGIFDVATLAVASSSRRSTIPVAHLLIAGCIRSMKRLQMQHTTTFVRSDLLHYLRDALCLPWEDLGGLGETQYVDGDPFLSQPAYLNFGALLNALNQARIGRELGRPGKGGPEHERFVDLVNAPEFDSIFLA